MGTRNPSSLQHNIMFSRQLQQFLGVWRAKEALGLTNVQLLTQCFKMVFVLFACQSSVLPSRGCYLSTERLHSLQLVTEVHFCRISYWQFGATLILTCTRERLPCQKQSFAAEATAAEHGLFPVPGLQ